jgi:hypothetical protein
MARPHAVLCPYCFERWSTHVAAFRCTRDDPQRCPPVADEPFGRLRGGATPLLPPVVVRKGHLGQAFAVKPGKPVCCDCGARARPVCPNCHCNLPQRFGDAASRSMALIGTHASGKTHFVTVAIHELQHRVGRRFGATLTYLDESTEHRLDRELKRRLYDARTVLAPTQSVVTNVDVREPLVTRLSLGDGSPAHASNLVFFDAAGEDLERLSVLEREARYITQSDGLILLIDPLQIPAVRDELAGHVELPDDAADVYAMVGWIAGLVREMHTIPAGRKIDLPIALTISKLDAVRPLLSDTHPVFTLPEHEGRFDRQVAATISETLRADLAGWIGEHFDRYVRQEFETASYFGVSALGASPVGSSLPSGVAPFRVEDPILWLLDTWGAMPHR